MTRLTRERQRINTYLTKMTPADLNALEETSTLTYLNRYAIQSVIATAVRQGVVHPDDARSIADHLENDSPSLNGGWSRKTQLADRLATFAVISHAAKR